MLTKNFIKGRYEYWLQDRKKELDLDKQEITFDCFYNCVTSERPVILAHTVNFVLENVHMFKNFSNTELKRLNLDAKRGFYYKVYEFKKIYRIDILDKVINKYIDMYSRSF